MRGHWSVTTACVIASASLAPPPPHPPPDPRTFCTLSFQGVVRQDPPSPGEKGYNVFRNLVLHGLKEEEDFGVVFTGLSRLLNNLHVSRNTYMPGSAAEVSKGTMCPGLAWRFVFWRDWLRFFVLCACFFLRGEVGWRWKAFLGLSSPLQLRPLRGERGNIFGGV